MNSDAAFSLVIGGVIALVVGVIVLQVWAVHDCTATNDTRPSAPIYAQVGNMLVPIPQQQRRYVCPGGREEWL